MNKFFFFKCRKTNCKSNRIYANQCTYELQRIYVFRTLKAKAKRLQNSRLKLYTFCFQLHEWSNVAGRRLKTQVEKIKRKLVKKQ